MEKRSIFNKQTGEERIVNKIDLSKSISERLNIPRDDLWEILVDVQNAIIHSLIQIRDCKDENGKVEDNFVELPNICAFEVCDIEKDDKKAYGINISIAEDILNSVNDIKVGEKE